MLQNRNAFPHYITTNISYLRVALQDTFACRLLISIDQILSRVAIISRVHIPKSIIVSYFLYGLVHYFNVLFLLYALIKFSKAAKTHNWERLRDMFCELLTLISDWKECIDRSAIGLMVSSATTLDMIIFTPTHNPRDYFFV